jgi:hypothetical protein
MVEARTFDLEQRKKQFGFSALLFASRDWHIRLGRKHRPDETQFGTEASLDTDQVLTESKKIGRTLIEILDGIPILSSMLRGASFGNFPSNFA